MRLNPTTSTRSRLLWTLAAATLLIASARLTLTEEQPSTEATSTEPLPDVLYVPTPQDVIDKMLEAADVTKDDIVYDLGCGDGRVVVTAAKRYGCEAYGCDIDPARVEESLRNVRENGVEHLVQIEQTDLFTVDLAAASVVTLYLLPELNLRLVPQLRRLKPGARIVSHDFDIRGMEPHRVIEHVSSEDQRRRRIFLFIAPLRPSEG